MREKIEEIAEWFKEKWIGVVFPPIGIVVVAFGIWIAYTSPEAKLRILGGFVFALGGLMLFGFLWLT